MLRSVTSLRRKERRDDGYPDINSVRGAAASPARLDFLKNTNSSGKRALIASTLRNRLEQLSIINVFITRSE